ncbi:MAG: alpha-ketoglutarate-dependent dioxygenase AlkB [Sphingomonadales bacterium]|nr:alpha-ketoglutarate-dependent dioxygenase AlkB [Sphingomonadales bacterium]
MKRPDALELFGDSPVAGLATMAELVTPDEEQALCTAIDQAGLAPFQFQRWTGRRLTASYGWRYDFQASELERAEAIPGWLEGVRCRAAEFAGVAAADLVHCLLTRYDPGAGIGWHRDRPVYEHVVGISLGAAATLRLRRRHAGRWQRASLPLAPRGAYHLSGDARHAWEHSIAPMAQTRWSITFRTFSPAGRRIAEG